MNIFFDFIKKARNQTLVGVLSSFVFIPTLAYAGVFSFVGGLSFAEVKPKESFPSSSQTANLLEVKLDEQRMINLESYGGPRVAIAADGALIPEFSPYSIDYEIAEVTGSTGQIVIYTVQSGDTLSQIAERYGISTNTISWANGIKKGDTVREGQELVLLPITGIQVEVKEGDSISTIATRYAGDAEEIANYNNLDLDESLIAGAKIIIPDGELGAEPTKKVAEKKTEKKAVTKKQNPSSGTVAKKSELENYFIRPVDGIVSQRKHGPYEATDVANKIGTPVYAMADGVVILSKSSGWNGGYGNMIIIKHPNKTQTLYGHLDSVDVSVGQSVSQGEKIGGLGNTGRSTGPHLHFEVRGDPDPVPTPNLY
jgi:murein DD-endopeptidase MepM/ murein hydrolase activator NlpD